MRDRFLGLSNIEKDVAKMGVYLQDRYPLPLDFFVYDLTNGAAVQNINTYITSIRFPDSSTPGIRMQFPLPSAWAGKTLSIYNYWCPSDAVAGNVTFNYGVVLLTPDSVMPGSAADTDANTVASPAVASKLTLDIGVLSLASFTAGDAIGIYVNRDSSDTYANYVSIIALKTVITP